MHGVLEGGRPKNCQEYPRYFCELIVTAIERELADTEWLGKIYKTLDATKSVEALMTIVEKIEGEGKCETPPHEEDKE